MEQSQPLFPFKDGNFGDYNLVMTGIHYQIKQSFLAQRANK